MTFRRALSTNYAFLSLMVLAVVAVVLGTAYIIFREHQTTETEAFNRCALNARIFEEQLTRSLETVHRFSEFMVAGPTDTAAMGDLFQRTLRQAPFLRSLSLLDTDGTILASSNPANIGTHIDPGDFFPQASPMVGESIRLGRPWSGRDFNAGRPATTVQPAFPADPTFVPLFCRAKGEGRAVLILAALNPDYFLNAFSQWLENGDGFFEMLRYDRVPLLASNDQPLGGSPVESSGFAERVRETEIGHFLDTTAGQRASFVAYRVSRLFPFAVIVHLYRDQALANWRKASIRLVSFAAPTLFALAYLATTLHRRERRRIQEEEAARRREYERLAATVFETVLEAVMVIDGELRLMTVNPAFTRITGFSAAEATGADLSLLAPGNEHDDFKTKLQHNLRAQGHWEGQVQYRRKSGDPFIAWMSINQVRDDAGKVVHHVAGFADITQYWIEAERISHLAHHDPLTGLPNRALLLERLQQEMKRVQRDRSQLALLYFDLDKFKPVNDLLGHAVGDQLLIALSKRLLAEVRDADTMARLGGDEFVILLHGIRNPRASVVVAEKIRKAAELPFLINGHKIKISTSIGIAFFPEHANSGEELLQCADKAMYTAKHLGGNRIEIYKT